MISRSRHLFLIVAVLCFWMAACTQQRQPCTQPQNVALRTGIYQVVFDTTLDTFGTGAISVVESIIDSVLPRPTYGIIDSAGNIRDLFVYGPLYKIPLSLSPVADSCRWIISPDSTLVPFDTLTFYYSRQLTFVSTGCGYAYYYTLTNAKTTYHSIDSIIVENTSVSNNVNIENLKIYY